MKAAYAVSNNMIETIERDIWGQSKNSLLGHGLPLRCPSFYSDPNYLSVRQADVACLDDMLPVFKRD